MTEPVEIVLENHVAAFLMRHQAAAKESALRMAVALSGGIDSMVLLDILYRLHNQSPAPSFELEAIHVNHGISPNADRWAEFCKAECARRHIAITVEVVTVDRNSGAGLEAAAREARYAALIKTPVAIILVAQHQDDQAETVLHQMLRGTGLNGLAAMGEARALSTTPSTTPSTTQTLLRPLLTIRREAIVAYAKVRALHWIEDESNTDTAYTRNYIRHTLMPVIAQRFPHYADSLARTAQHAAESAALNDALARIDLKWNGAEAFADALDTLSSSRQVNALYHWLRWQNITSASRSQLQAWAAQLFRAAPDSKPHQAGGHDFVIRRQHDRLILITQLAN